MSQNIRAKSLIQKDGELIFVESFLEDGYAQECFEFLLQHLDWKQESYQIYGKDVLAPRLVAWYGDAGANYSYSGTEHEPMPWLPLLVELRNSIAQYTQQDFNSVLANLYRNGIDSMGWHADQEPELGKNPFIASLSLGDTRVFKLRHRLTKEVVKKELPSGSLVLMGGALQHHWQHCVPKTAIDKSSRINLTYREIAVRDS